MLGKCCKKSAGSNSGATATVVDGKLILSLPEAIDPVVWQMDLTGAKASALEVRSNDEKGLYTLTLKTPKGETVEVATFSDRAQSVEGLMAASGALERAHGQIRPGAAPANDGTPAISTGKAPAQKRGAAMTIFLGLVVLFVLYVIWASMMPLPADMNDMNGVVSATSDENGPIGVPLSADAYLQEQ